MVCKKLIAPNIKNLLSLLSIALMCNTAYAVTRNETKIRNMLAAQVIEWNKGNIAGYMVGYWQHDSLVFVGKNGPTYGYNNTLDRYKRSYPDALSMGKLTSTVLIIKKLSHKYYFINGIWHLKRKNGDLSGNFTLLLKKIGRSWVIIYDHSS